MENYFAPILTSTQLHAISPLGLAHIGDGVFELLVRTWLITCGKATAGSLHRATVTYVSAPAQAARVEKMLPLLTETELAFYKRGRNANVHFVPKNASRGQYSRAPGLESLFGALYLQGQNDRLNELFNLTMEDDHAI
ncbi:MAG: ribonuclease III domain-containing protein [Eubacteriales bacterium]